MKFNHKVSPTYTSNIFSTNLNPKPLRTPKTTNTFNSQILNHASPKTQERELFQNRKRVMSQTTNQIKEALTNNYYSVEERSIEEEEEDYCEQLNNIRKDSLYNNSQLALKKLKNLQSNIFNSSKQQQMNDIRHLQIVNKQQKIIKMNRSLSEAQIIQKKFQSLKSRSIQKLLSQDDTSINSDSQQTTKKQRMSKLFMDDESNKTVKNQQQSNLFNGQLTNYYTTHENHITGHLFPYDVCWMTHDSIKYKSNQQNDQNIFSDFESNRPNDSLKNMTNQQTTKKPKRQQEQKDKTPEQSFSKVENQEEKLNKFQLKFVSKAPGFNLTQFKQLCNNFGYQALTQNNKLKIDKNPNSFVLVPSKGSNIHQIVKNLEKQQNKIHLLQMTKQETSYMRLHQEKKKKEK